MSSTIYDLGYQTYKGARHGRMYAMRTLFGFSLRAAFGMGRGEQARRVPAVVAMVLFLPAVIQVGVASAAGMSNLVHYAAYLEFTAILLALFVAAQAPELIVTDKQNGALALYLSRPIRATDYAIAKLAALTVATFLFAVLPQLVLFGGKVLLAKDLWPAFKGELPRLEPIFLSAALIAFFLASVALGLASFAVKRAYASAAVIALFLIAPAISEIVRFVATGDIRRWAVLVNPLLVISGLAHWLFHLEISRRSIVGRVDLPGEAYLLTALGAAAVGAAVLMVRYRRNEA
jgi:ABC-2 type transport system permease protein